MPVDYDRMAQVVMFSGTLVPSNYGAEYRKGKGRDDVVKAMTKALNPKNGRGKTEVELSMLAVYLQGIFKRAAPPGQ